MQPEFPPPTDIEFASIPSPYSMLRLQLYPYNLFDKVCLLSIPVFHRNFWKGYLSLQLDFRLDEIEFYFLSFVGGRRNMVICKRCYNLCPNLPIKLVLYLVFPDNLWCFVIVICKKKNELFLKSEEIDAHIESPKRTLTHKMSRLSPPKFLKILDGSL